MTFPNIATLLFSSWPTIEAPAANHLWQSTAFAGMVWLLTLLLRKSHAQARYILWLVATAKFLVPFSLLIGMGSHLAWPKTAAVTQPRLFIAMKAIGQPFSPTNPPSVPISAAPSVLEVALRNLPVFLLMVWFAGCVAVLLLWYLRWRRLTAARQAALPSESERELEALRRMERSLRPPQQITLILLQSAREPGVLGVFRPVLVLPAGISDRLTDAQLESVIAHELCHVRRRDNLAAALHMFVEAVFWFHAKPADTYRNGLKDPHGRPIGSGIFQPGPCKLVGQGIPVAALAFDLSQQLSRIVVDKTNLKGNYDFTLDCHTAFMERGDSLLTVLPEQLGLELNEQTVLVEMLVIDHADKLTADQSSQTQPQDQSLAESVAASMPPALVYKAVSIKPDNSSATPTPTRNFPPDGFNATNVTLQSLIAWAYHVEGFQISGAPGWISTERYDVEAKVDSSVADELQSRSEEQRGAKQQPMLLELLADHFKLEAHRETREVPVYELVIAGSGPKLQQAKTGESPFVRFAKGLIVGQAEPIGPTNNGRPSLVRMLSLDLQRPVLDKTGLEGTYDFSLEWTPGDKQGTEHGPSIFAAVQEQLGLKLLESNEQTASVQMLVIDHAEKPAEN